MGLPGRPRWPLRSACPETPSAAGPRAGCPSGRTRRARSAGHRPAADPSLAHLTMNTGHLPHSPRDQVLPATVARLAPLVAVGRGEAAGIPFAVDRRSEGAALFHLGEPPVVVCGVCWREDR